MRPERRLLLTRRRFSVGAASCLAAGPALADGGHIAARFKAIEARTGGRLGVSAFQVGGDDFVGWRETERFLMCSTFKALAVSAVLARVDRGRERLDRWIAYGPQDLQDYAPAAKANVGKGGMTLEAICAAAIELSDNTCANLILARLGGPQGVTTFVRSLGDSVTRLDRTEPELNRPGPPGDTRDTTTTESMTGLWRKLLFGEALSASSRDRLSGWLAKCKTGPDRLTAATPAGWQIGHKTGSGSTTAGDIAVWTPPAGAPILIAVYFNLPGVLDRPHDEVFVEAGRIALSVLAPGAGAAPRG